MALSLVRSVSIESLALASLHLLGVAEGIVVTLGWHITVVPLSFLVIHTASSVGVLEVVQVFSLGKVGPHLALHVLELLLKGLDALKLPEFSFR